MELNGDRRVLLTGAAGGLGRALTSILAGRGCTLCLVDRQAATLEEVVQAAGNAGGRAHALDADLAGAEGCARVAEWIGTHWNGHADVVIHNAGVLDFLPFQDSDPGRVTTIMAVNALAPMLLTQALLPAMLQRDCGHLVFVGSVLGALALPFYASYSASKFALRGFAEALRRELDGSGLRVTYVGPRTMRTAINGPAVQRMAEHTGLRMDDPAAVAARIVEAIERDRPELHIGFPERLFARINGVAPRLVDRAMRQEARRMRPFATAAPPDPA